MRTGGQQPSASPAIGTQPPLASACARIRPLVHIGDDHWLASLIAIIAVGALTIWITYKVGTPKRQLTYGMVDTPLLATTSTVATRDLRVVYLGAELVEPRVLSLRLACRGRKDIASGDFDQGKPLPSM